MIRFPGGILYFDAENQQFIAETNDINLIGQELPYSITVEFTSYRLVDHPQVSTAEASNTILFLDPCKSPFFFQETAQTDPSSATFNGAPVQFTLNPFSVVPSRCGI